MGTAVKKKTMCTAVLVALTPDGLSTRVRYSGLVSTFFGASAAATTGRAFWPSTRSRASVREPTQSLEIERSAQSARDQINVTATTGELSSDCTHYCRVIKPYLSSLPTTSVTQQCHTPRG